MRGLSSLIILRGIMERVNQGRSVAARLRPCQIMDIIGGTSTGGLVYLRHLSSEGLLNRVQSHRDNARASGHGRG